MEQWGDLSTQCQRNHEKERERKRERVEKTKWELNGTYCHQIINLILTGLAKMQCVRPPDISMGKMMINQWIFFFFRQH